MNFKTTILVSGILLLSQTNSMQFSRQKNSRLFSSNQNNQFQQNNKILQNKNDESKNNEVLTDSIRESMQRRVNYSQQLPSQQTNQTMRQSKKSNVFKQGNFKQSDQFKFSLIEKKKEIGQNVTENDIILMEQNIDLESQMNEMKEQLENQKSAIDELNKWKQQQKGTEYQNHTFKIITGIALLALIIMCSVALSN